MQRDRSWQRNIVGLVAAVLVAGLGASCNGDGEESVVADRPATTTTGAPIDDDATTTTDGAGGAARCPGGDAVDLAETPAGAVAADLDGDGVDDMAWVEPVAGEPAVLNAILSDGLFVQVTMGEHEPVLEPEIVSVVDIGDDRDTVLARFDAGAYTELTGTFGFADCELVPIVDPEAPELGPFVLAYGASVQNGTAWGCYDAPAGTALVRVNWSFVEDGEGFDWSEGLSRRDGTEMVQAGEVVAGIAETEDEIGTDRAEDCPEPTRV